MKKITKSQNENEKIISKQVVIKYFPIFLSFNSKNFVIIMSEQSTSVNPTPFYAVFTRKQLQLMNRKGLKFLHMAIPFIINNKNERIAVPRSNIVIHPKDVWAMDEVRRRMTNYCNGEKTYDPHNEGSSFWPSEVSNWGGKVWPAQQQGKNCCTSSGG
jgi:hypothetical protein